MSCRARRAVATAALLPACLRLGCDALVVGEAAGNHWGWGKKKASVKYEDLPRSMLPVSETTSGCGTCVRLAWGGPRCMLGAPKAEDQKDNSDMRVFDEIRPDRVYLGSEVFPAMTRMAKASKTKRVMQIGTKWFNIRDFAAWKNKVPDVEYWSMDPTSYVKNLAYPACWSSVYDNFLHSTAQDAPKIYPGVKGYFDVVTSIDVLGHGKVVPFAEWNDPNVNAYLQGCAAMLKKDGVFFFKSTHPLTKNATYDQLEQAYMQRTLAKNFDLKDPKSTWDPEMLMDSTNTTFKFWPAMTKRAVVEVPHAIELSVKPTAATTPIDADAKLRHQLSAEGAKLAAMY